MAISIFLVRGPAPEADRQDAHSQRRGKADGDAERRPGSPSSAIATTLRTADLPAEARPRAFPAEGRRPADRPYLYAAALGAGLFAVLGLLGAVALVTVGGGDLVPFFLVPIALGAVALLLAYRLWRRPHEGPPR